MAECAADRVGRRSRHPAETGSPITAPGLNALLRFIAREIARDVGVERVSAERGRSADRQQAQRSGRRQPAEIVQRFPATAPTVGGLSASLSGDPSRTARRAGAAVPSTAASIRTAHRYDIDMLVIISVPLRRSFEADEPPAAAAQPEVRLDRRPPRRMRLPIALSATWMNAPSVLRQPRSDRAAAVRVRRFRRAIRPSRSRCRTRPLRAITLRRGRDVGVDRRIAECQAAVGADRRSSIGFTGVR